MKKNKDAKKLSSEELAYFCAQLSLILRSGVALNDGLLMMLDDIKDNSSYEVIKHVAECVDKQESLYKALEETNKFSSYFVSMIKVGEMSGHLDNVLEGLSVHYLREANTKSAVRSAVLHPSLLLIIMAAVIAVMLIKVVPVFRDVFVQIGSQFSNTSYAAVDFAKTTGTIVLSILGVIVLVGIIIYFIYCNKKGRKALIRLFSKIFIFKGLIEKMSLCRFSSAMSLMISSGFNTTDAVKLSREVVTSSVVQKKLEKCCEDLDESKSFSDSIVQNKLFPPLYNQMIKISYKSGVLDTVWEQISEKYDEDVNNSLDNMIAFIEPLLVGILTVIIGVMLISVLFPLMEIMSSLS